MTWLNGQWIVAYRERFGFGMCAMLLGLLLLVAPNVFSQNLETLTQQAQPEVLAPNSPTQQVYLLTLDDQMVSPITAEYITEGIEHAQREHAAAVVLQLDTPGGLLTSTHKIVKSILNAPLPVIVYVGPEGARAGSAGVFITLSAHIAAMNPNSRIGAAHPVTGNGTWPATPAENEDLPDMEGAPNISKAMKKKPLTSAEQQVMAEKILNDTVAGIRALAKSRGRNADWAERAVLESASIPADEAVRNNVVDVLAQNVMSLLQKVDGKEVQVQGHTHKMVLSNPVLVVQEFSLRHQVLGVLTHPMLSYFLLMIGFYGIVFEITHPGFGVSGIAGVICVLLALIGMQGMPINLAGVALMGFGMLLFIVEVFTPSFGLLFGAGLLSLLLGTTMAYQSHDPMVVQVFPYAVGTSLAVGVATGFFLWKAMTALHRKSKDPFEKLVGEHGRVLSPVLPKGDAGPVGKVRVYGEVWLAETERDSSVLVPDSSVVVLALDRERRVLLVALV